MSIKHTQTDNSPSWLEEAFCDIQQVLPNNQLVHMHVHLLALAVPRWAQSASHQELDLE
jgi:hypothetical protein